VSCWNGSPDSSPSGQVCWLLALSSHVNCAHRGTWCATVPVRSRFRPTRSLPSDSRQCTDPGAGLRQNSRSIPWKGATINQTFGPELAEAGLPPSLSLAGFFGAGHRNQRFGSAFRRWLAANVAFCFLGSRSGSRVGGKSFGKYPQQGLAGPLCVGHLCGNLNRPASPFQRQAYDASKERRYGRPLAAMIDGGTRGRGPMFGIRRREFITLESKPINSSGPTRRS
jgi:hypothetical protein